MLDGVGCGQLLGDGSARLDAVLPLGFPCSDESLLGNLSCPLFPGKGSFRSIS